MGTTDVTNAYKGIGIHLADAGWTNKQLAEALLATDVYKADAGGVSDETFIKHVYKNVTGSTATLAEVTALTNWMTANKYSQADVLVTASELAAFETTIDNGVSVFYSLKFPAHKGNFFNNIPVIRLSEVYLIRAEARARQAKDALAQADLTTLRTNRGLGAVPAATTGTALIDLIFNERRVELHLEGHRFFDFKRRGLNILKPAGIPTLLYTDFKVLASLPSAQVLLNPLIKQNPGY